MTKSKAIGTAAETALVRYLRANGFPLADRLPLKGSKDIGDVGDGTGAVIFEVKAGKAAETASRQQIALWLIDTEREQDNAKADWGILVLKRAGKGEAQIGSWWAVTRFSPTSGAPWITHFWYLDETVMFLRSQGYGEPL